MRQIDWISWTLKIVRVCQSQLPIEDLSFRSSLRNRHLLLIGLMILTLSYASVAQAETLVSDRVSEPQVAANPDPAPDRLMIPANAAEVPVGAESWENLPPPEPPATIPMAEAAPEMVSNAAPVAMTLLQTIKSQTAKSQTAKSQTAAKPVELNFGFPPQPSAQPQTAVASIPEAAAPSSVNPAVPLADSAALFVGNSDSLVAKAVGSAEGTRTPEGDRNPAYFGHVDPGNKAWNLGSFSYQHEAVTPEDADAKQLNRLQDQAGIMQAKAQSKGMSLTLEEALNGIDLANQAPKAVLERDGYIDWLAKAHQNGLSGDDAVLWARTQSFFDPNLQRWNAPGLGNTQESINHDQERRMRAIERAIAIHQPPLVSSTIQSAAPAPQTLPQPVAPVSLPKVSEDIGIARLFAEQAITHFGKSVPLPEIHQPDSIPWSAPGLTNSTPERQAIASPDTAALSKSSVEPPGIAALFNLDLPRS